MDIERVLHMARQETEEGRLLMILGNRIDHGSADGGLISVKQFGELAKDLLRWREASRAEGAGPGVVAQEEGDWC